MNALLKEMIPIAEQQGFGSDVFEAVVEMLTEMGLLDIENEQASLSSDAITLLYSMCVFVNVGTAPGAVTRAEDGFDLEGTAVAALFKATGEMVNAINQHIEPTEEQEPEV